MSWSVEHMILEAKKKKEGMCASYLCNVELQVEVLVLKGEYFTLK